MRAARTKPRKKKSGSKNNNNNNNPHSGTATPTLPLYYVDSLLYIRIIISNNGQ